MGCRRNLLFQVKQKAVLLLLLAVFETLIKFTDVSCRLLLFFSYILVYNLMSILVSIDRMIAVGATSGIWYKQKCTQKTAWIPISMVVLLLLVTGAPIPICATVANIGGMATLNFFKGVKDSALKNKSPKIAS